jgi:hypothetical protein
MKLPTLGALYWVCMQFAKIILMFALRGSSAAFAAIVILARPRES